MRNFILLCRLQTEQVFHAAFSGLKTAKKEPTATAAVLILAGFSLFMSSLYGFLFAGMMTQSGAELFYFPVMLLFSLFFGFLFSFMGAKDVLFSGRDLDFLMSMPVSPHLIMLSRMTALYLENLLFVGIWMLPANAAAQFFSIAPASALWLSFLPVILLFPLLPAFFAALCGFLFAWIQARHQKNALLGSVISILFLCAVLLLCLQASRLEELFFANRDRLLDLLRTYLFPVWLVSGGICGDPAALAGGLLICSLPFAVFALLLSRHYKQLLSALQAKALRSGFRLPVLKKHSPFCALFKTELYRLTHSPLYLTNTCFGIVFLIGTEVFLVFSKERLSPALTLLGTDLFAPVLLLLMAFFLSSVYPSSISISLDGRALWILKEAPLPAAVFFGAKACLNLALTWPACLICAFLPGFAGILSLSDSFFLLLPALSLTAFWAVWGLVLNLRFPKTDCPSEAAIVKNSASAVIGILGNMLTVLLSAGIWALCTFPMSLPFSAVSLLLTLLFSGLTILCRHTLLTWGAKRLAQIN